MAGAGSLLKKAIKKPKPNGAGSVKKPINKKITKKRDALLKDTKKGVNKSNKKPKGYRPEPLELQLIKQIEDHPVKWPREFGFGDGTDVLKIIKFELNRAKKAGYSSYASFKRAEAEGGTIIPKKSSPAKKQKSKLAGVSDPKKAQLALTMGKGGPSKVRKVYAAQEAIRKAAAKEGMSVKAFRKKYPTNKHVKELYDLKPNIKRADDNR